MNIRKYTKKYKNVKSASLSTRIKDNITPDKKCIVWHSTSSKDLADIIIRKEFKAGRGGGKMIGGGFYCNLHLFQAQKNNYGPLILKAEIKALDNFIFLEWEPFNTYFGVIPDVNSTNFISYQAKKFGIPDSREPGRDKRYFSSPGMYNILSDIRVSKFSSTARYAQSLYESNIHLKGKKMKPVGIVYAGGFDGLSIVCWYPKLFVVPLAISSDNGKTWEDKNNFEFENEVGTKAKSVASTNFQKTPEEVRSEMRAKDLIEKIEKETFGKDGFLKSPANQVSAHLSKIKNKEKWDMRMQAILNERPEWKDALSGIQFTGN